MLATALIGLVLFAGGCTTPSSPPTVATSSPASPSVTASATTAPDFTQPEAGLEIIRKLIDAAGNSRTIMVQVSRTEATVTVVVGAEAQAWGYRDGAIKQVATDIQYVDQAIFDINDFNLSDVGALFRTASSVSGSDAQQSLQVVDYSGGDVLMTVSTNPESRPVFFRSDGTLVSTLDFHTKSGIEEGLTDAIGQKQQVFRVGVDSALGAYIDYVGMNNTTLRRLRPAKFPASTSGRSNAPDRPEFHASVVSADRIWQVLEGLRQEGTFTSETVWSVAVEDREGTGTPKMYFTVGGTSFTTTLDGEKVG